MFKNKMDIQVGYDAHFVQIILSDATVPISLFQLGNMNILVEYPSWI